MVKRPAQGTLRITVLLAWLTLASAVTAAPALTVEIEPSQPRYGDAFTMRIHTRGIDTPLGKLDLEPLRNEFRIERQTVAGSGQPDADQRLELELRPRRAGTLEIPALYLGGARSEARALQVAPAVDGTDPLQIETAISPQETWAREQILVQVTVRSRQRFFEWHAPEFRDPRFTVLALQTRTRQERVGDVDYTVKTTGWALFPWRSGALQLDPPAVEYRRGGRLQARFALPQLRLQVRPLPPYVPSDLPVGTLHLSTRVEAPALLNTDTLATWEMEARGEGVAAAALPSLLAPVRDRERLRFLPAEEQRSQDADGRGTRSVLRYRIPFVATASGRHVLPALELQYFNPDSGRIERLASAPRPIWVLGSAWRAGLLAVVLGALVLAGIHARRVLGAHGARLRRRRQVLEELDTASDARGIRAALNRFGRGEGWPLDGSLQSWLQGFRQHYRCRDGDLEAVLAALNRGEFAPTDSGRELARLRPQLAATLRRARRRRRR